MVFSSSIFVFVFLPVFLALYYATPPRLRSYTILCGSLAFYGWWRLDFLALMLAVILGTYCIGKKMAQQDEAANRKRWLTIGVVLNLGVLGVFKYFNFGIESLNALFNASGQNSIEAIRFILPIGISFYIFQAVSYLIDVYRKDTSPAARFIDFATFISLFPQLIAGPILRYKDLAAQFQNRAHSLSIFGEGARRFMIGFIYKVLIADTIAPLADAAFALEHPGTGDAWLGALAYTMQLYFDFAGYSHMAIGLGLMMGFRFIENFNMPYLSASITEFWRRWHISLSTWLRDYLYIPLGGNRYGKLITSRNIGITMLLGGLWHGANWTFVLWGAFHGALMIIERLCGMRGHDQITLSIKRITATVFTFLLVMVGWVMFRAQNIGAALDMYEGMMGLNGLGISDHMAWQIQGISLATLGLGAALIFLEPLFKAFQKHNVLSIPRAGLLCLIFILSVSRLIAQGYSPFLYFQF